MSPAPRLAVALQVDDGRPLDALLALLDEDDRPAAAAHAGRRRRHFALGRLAAARARGRLPGPRCQQAPGISIAHSGLLAAACAWTADAGTLVGLDLERVRAFDVAATHAFTSRERRVLRGAGGDAMAAGMAGWVAKEAAFKALRLPAEAGPEAVELREMDGKRGWARVVGRRRGVRGVAFDVRLRRITRPDGVYVLGLARGEGRS